MEKIKIGLGILVVSILAISGTTTAVGSIIPVAERAREYVYENAVAPEHSPVININEDGLWVLTPSLSDEPDTVIPEADGKIIPVAERAREYVYEHAVAWEHSPVININEDGLWVLTPSPYYVESDSLYAAAMSNGSGFATIPEPATMTLLTLGTLALVGRRRI